MHLIELNNVTKCYGSLCILSDINITVESNCSYAIVGNSGTGKSTLLHIMALLDSPSVGEILVDGQNVADLSDNVLSAIRNKKFGFVFQENYLLEDYNALENVMIPCLIGRNNDFKAVKEKATELLISLGLNDRLYHLPAQLSGGEKQRVALCRALINKPDIVFADEPTGSLDEENALQVEKLLIDTVVKKENSTLVLVTHNNEFASECDNVYQIKNHRLSKIK